jgi:hypothetical protein
MAAMTATAPYSTIGTIRDCPPEKANRNVDTRYMNPLITPMRSTINTATTTFVAQVIAARLAAGVG